MPVYSRRALARLAFSSAAAQLADRARSRVPTNDDSWSKPGELLDEARSLLVAAEELVEKAIIFERERGTSWTELGEVLGVSKQAAQQKHAPAVEDWTEGLNQSLTAVDGHFAFSQVPGEGGDTPEQLAERLDEWALRHPEKHNKPRGTKPVSQGLELASSTEQIVLLNRLAKRMINERAPDKLRAFHAAKAALMASLAEEAPEDIDAQRTAAQSQRELEVLNAAKASEKKARVVSITDAKKKTPRRPRA
jgi:hypothetical protein